MYNVVHITHFSAKEFTVRKIMCFFLACEFFIIKYYFSIIN